MTLLEGVNGVHHYSGERCTWCGLGVFQIFTDREDVLNAIYCLEARIRYGDLGNWADEA